MPNRYGAELDYLGTEVVTRKHVDALLKFIQPDRPQWLNLIASDIIQGLQRSMAAHRPPKPTKPSGWFGRWTSQDINAAYVAGIAEGHRKATAEFVDELGQIILVPMLESAKEGEEQ